MARNAKKKENRAADRPPFEKVRFNREVNHIYGRCAKEASEFYCKSESDNMFGFKPESYSEKWGLHGQVIVFEPPPPIASDQVVVNFSLGQERFFTTAEFRPLGGNGILRMPGPLFRLERRGHLRIPLDEAVQKDCNIIARASQTVFMPADVLNLSQGGMRLRMGLSNKYMPVQTGETLRFVLHINRRWRIEMDGEIRHAGVDGIHNFCGVEFVNLEDNEKRKLISLIMELQRKYMQYEP